MGLPGIPFSTSLLELRQFRASDERHLLITALHEVGGQATADVPGNVAVEQPVTGVVSLEGNDKPSICSNHYKRLLATMSKGDEELDLLTGNITTGRVVEAEAARVGCGEGSRTVGRSQYQKVMAVDVHRMRNWIIESD
jgi:hypothetical protein